jgi:hypothetical protein
MHLLSSSVFILVLLLGVISVPLMYIRYTFMSPDMIFAVKVLAGVLQMSFYIFALLYLVTMYKREGSFMGMMTRFVKNYIPFLSLSMGMSFHNTIAVLQGYSGKETPFVRTPKMNLQKKGDKWAANSYLSKRVAPSVWIELALAFYFAFGIGMAIHFEAFNIMPFLALEMFGFGAIAFFSFRHAKQIAG